MGISYAEPYSVDTKNCISKLYDYNSKEMNNEIKEITSNAVYRNNVVYKECSYEIPKLNIVKNQHNNKIECPSKDHLNKSSLFTWSKVYKSPLERKRCITQKCDSELDNCQDVDIICECDKMNETTIQVTKNTVGTSAISLNKFKKQLNTHLLLRKIASPRFLCPCCTGGDDNLDQCYRNTTKSFDSVDLTTKSDVLSPNLELDPSVLSLMRTLEVKKKPRIYTKIIGLVLRNTYKNAVCLLDPLKAM